MSNFLHIYTAVTRVFKIDLIFLEIFDYELLIWDDVPYEHWKVIFP